MNYIYLYYDICENIWLDEDGFRIIDINEWIPPWVFELFIGDLKDYISECGFNAEAVDWGDWMLQISTRTTVVIRPVDSTLNNES